MNPGGRHGGRTTLVAVALVALIGLPGSAAAQGGYEPDPTREQWVAQADGACRDATPRFNQLVKKVNRAGKRGKPVKYGHVLVRLAKFLLDVRAEIAEFPRPPDDELIAKWLRTAIKADRTALRSGKAYARGSYGQGKKAFKKAAKLSRKSAKLAQPFAFEHC